MRFVIYGAGGVGGTIGVRLAQSGAEVLLIARGAHLEAIKAHGLELVAPGERGRHQLAAVGHPSEIDWRSSDVVLLCVKSQHTDSALADLRAAAPAEVAVVCAQNGVANERAALRLFKNVYAMLVILPGLHLEPGVVVTHATEVGGVLDVGRYRAYSQAGSQQDPDDGTDECAESIAAALERAGFSCIADPRVMRSKYAKLLGNLSNALQAATDMAEGSIEINRALRREALACYAAAGIDCASREEVEEQFARGMKYGEVQGSPRSGGSSWQSIARATGNVESDFLNGEIVLLGRMFGVPVPANEALQALGNLMAEEGIAPGSFTPAQVQARIEAISIS